MIFRSEAALDRYRHKSRCEWCRKPARSALDPHHLFKRGIGGGSRLDADLNLIALCRSCHTDAEAGVITQFDLLAIVAQREACQQADIQEVVHCLLRLPKEATAERIEKGLEGLSESAAQLFRKTWKEIGK